MKTISDSQLSQLSAYIDDELTPAERAALEAQLAHDPALRTELAELQSTVLLLSELPAVVPPRTWTLDPAVYGKPRRVFSWMRWTASVGAFVLIIAVGLGIFSNQLQNRFEAASWTPVESRESAPASAAQAPFDLQLTITIDQSLAAGDTAKLQSTALPTNQPTAPPQRTSTAMRLPTTGAGASAATAAPPIQPYATPARINPATTRPSLATSAPAVGGVPPVQPPAPPTAERVIRTAVLEIQSTSTPLPAAALLPGGNQPNPAAPPAGAPAALPEGLSSNPLITNTVPLPAFDSVNPSAADPLVPPFEPASGGLGANPEQPQTRIDQPAAAPSLGLLFLVISLAGVLLAALFLGWSRRAGRNAGK